MVIHMVMGEWLMGVWNNFFELFNWQNSSQESDKYLISRQISWWQKEFVQTDKVNCPHVRRMRWNSHRWVIFNRDINVSRFGKTEQLVQNDASRIHNTIESNAMTEKGRFTRSSFFNEPHHIIIVQCIGYVDTRQTAVISHGRYSEKFVFDGPDMLKLTFVTVAVINEEELHIVPFKWQYLGAVPCVLQIAPHCLK